MSKYIPKSKGFLNLISKRKEFLVGLVYLYLVQKIAYPLNFQQDDISELYIVNFTEFLCVLTQGDNHPLFTNFIWFVSRIFDTNLGYIISTFNILISLSSLIFFYNFIKKYSGNNTATLVSLIFLSSSNFIVYSISLKQYPLEVLGSIFYITFLYQKINEDLPVLSDYKKLFIALVFAISSLTLFVLFVISISIIILNKRIEIKNFFKALTIFSPSFFFIPNIVDKITRSTYREYWDTFFIDIESLSSFIQSATFIFNLVMKGYFGLFFYEPLSLLYFIFLLLPIIFRDKMAIPAYVILMTFMIFNILKLYPLGGGRTDLVLFPFFLFVISRSISVLKLKKQLITTFMIILLALVPLFNEPYYKVENITPILDDISSSINNDNAYILPMDEQKRSFEYYSATLYGSVEITTKNGCKYLVPNVNNYSIFLPENEDSWNKIYKTFNSDQLSEIYLIGIELDGTRGQIRDAENYLKNSGFNKLYEKNYDVGMLLIKYTK